MGNCCSDGNESEKPNVFVDASQIISEDNVLQEQQHQNIQVVDESILTESQQQQQSFEKINKNAEAERALREEQARLELIVSTAGRDMVAVRSTRANPGYYEDQGFAAALAQLLASGSSFALPNTLPEPSSSDTNNVYATLNSSPWENVQLGTNSTGLAGCAGENPNTYMDHVAESVLASMVPTKEHLFNNVGPMVENLL